MEYNRFLISAMANGKSNVFRRFAYKNIGGVIVYKGTFMDNNYER